MSAMVPEPCDHTNLCDVASLGLGFRDANNS